MGKIFNIASELLDKNIRDRSNKTVFYCGQSRVSYAELGENVNRFGKLLEVEGIKPKERIAIVLPDSCALVYAFLGSIKYGAWPVLISTALQTEDYKFILDDSAASLLVTCRNSGAENAESRCLRHKLFIDDDKGHSLLVQFSPQLDPFPSSEEDIAFMLYSSGSTGNPKGVPHLHRSMAFAADAYGNKVLGMSEADTNFSASKLSFAYGLGNSLSLPLYFGASSVLYPGKPIPDAVFRIFSEYRPSLFFGVPTFYNLLLKSVDDTVSFDSLRLCLSAGEALSSAIYHEWKQLTGKELVDGIGSTETLHVCISNMPGEVRPGKSGFIIPPYEARIIGADSRPVQPGQPGYLLIRGKSTAPYYWNRPDKTAESMLEDGWLKTGDIFSEEDGCFTYQGRCDDMFKVDGKWVSPIRIESILRAHPAVMECAVTSRKLEGLTRPCAHIVLNQGFSECPAVTAELRRHVLTELPAFMCPVQFRYCDELPKTGTGKIQRFRLMGK